VTPALAEALRNEIRVALEAGGKPFDINVARRVYDLAIAARDFCIAATDTVKETIDQIKDVGGAMESLVPQGSPEPPVQAAESFGARIFREMLALAPSIRVGLPPATPTAEPLVASGTESLALVHAIAAARERGMPDIAASLEKRLLGSAIDAVLSEGMPALIGGPKTPMVCGVCHSKLGDNGISGCAACIPTAIDGAA
jgi:hypothetical protein